MIQAFEVIDPGLSTTVQDLGRPGFLRLGVPEGGALDKEALRLANALVGGPPNQAALEIRVVGPTLRALSGPLEVALVGAEARMRLERETGAVEIGPWRSARLARGDVLRVGALKGSSTAVLAIGGGVAAPMTLGARATFARGGFGGIDGRALQAGDRLSIGLSFVAEQARWIPPLARPAEATAGADGVWTARVVLGPQSDHFSAEALRMFQQAVWALTRQADRMGLRLYGPPLAHLAGKGPDIASEAVAEGSIQVPGDGRPIVLLADRGATGGYAKIAVAASVDLPLLGRLAPGDRLRFQVVPVEAAQAALRGREEALRAAIAAIAPHHAPGVVDEAKLWEGELVTGFAVEALDPEED